MDDSDSSSLSEHSDKEIQKLAPIFIKAKKATKTAAPPPPVSPPRPKRSPSPPHEEVLADNPDIAFIIMFRSRFNDCLSTKLPHFGPQDLERGVVDSVPSPQVQQLMCALLGLVLNRKKPPERGHHGRALEEAVLSHKPHWPLSWNGQNPLHGGKNFENMSPNERLNLLRTLIMWALSSSEAIQATIKDKYKQNRHNDDENQPLSVQPWGFDGDKRRYFLVQGLDDTSFRVYREGHRYTKNAQWYSVAGSIEEVKQLSKKLEDVDGSQAARRLAGKMINAVPTFEATEEKRRRREYRQIRRAAFARPEPGFSLYEGRTRGKRMRYTYDDEDDSFLSEDNSVRRSNRQSSRNTPIDAGPTYTASGRQVRAPKTGDYGETLLSGAATSADEVDNGHQAAYARNSGSEEDSDQPVRGGGRSSRTGGRNLANGNGQNGKRKNIEGYNDIDEMSDEMDADSSGGEWDSDKNDAEDEEMPDADDEDDEVISEDEDMLDDDGEQQSLIVKLKVSPKPAPKEEAFDDKPVPEHAGLPKPMATDSTLEKPLLSTSSAALADHAASSPHAPSAYPTPTSTSFLPPEQKPSVATASAAQSSLPIPTSSLAPSLPPPSSETFVNGKTDSGHAGLP